MLNHLSKLDSRPPRVAIVGVKGFVGSALRSTLESAGMTVVPIGRPSVDLLEPECVDRLSTLWEPGDAVVVTAALTPDKGRDVVALIKNLRMAEHLASAITKRPCSHLVYFSSDAVYDSSQQVVSEATPAAPADLYGVMHLAREVLFREAAARAGVPYCVLRPCAIYGPGDTHNSYGPNRFIRSALAESRIRIFGAGEETRDHVYIGDVCNMTRLVLLHQSTGTLNLVSGQAVMFGWIASEVARLVGKHVAIEQLPRSGPVTHRRFDPAAAIEAFPGLKPTLLDAGLAISIAATRKS